MWVITITGCECGFVRMRIKTIQTSNKNFILRCRDGKRTETRIGMEGTVPLTINLTRSCESLASDSQLSREYVFVCARGRPGGLARNGWWSREEGLVVSRVRVCLLARKGWWSRECVFCLLARKAWWSRE